MEDILVGVTVTRIRSGRNEDNDMEKVFCGRWYYGLEVHQNSKNGNWNCDLQGVGTCAKLGKTEE